MFALPRAKSHYSSVEDLVAALRHGHYNKDILISSIGCFYDTIDLPVNGRTALSYAFESQYTSCVRILLLYSHSSNINKPDATGRTALSYAATAEKNHCISVFDRLTNHKLEDPWKIFLERLIDMNADPRSQDQTGRTPLSWAAGMGCGETVKFFCKKYEEDDAVFAADHGGRSPASYAAQAGYDGIVSTIFCTKKNYDDCDHENRTPLYWFIQERWKDDQSKNEPISDDAMYRYLPLGFRPEIQGTMRPTLNGGISIIKILNQSVKGKTTLLSEAVMHDDEHAVEGLMRIPHFTCDAINEEGGETALILALRYDKRSISRFLWGNLGESLEQINRHPSPEISFQRFLEVGESWLGYTPIGYEDLSQKRQFLRASLEEFLQYKEVEKVEQLLGRLIDTLRVPPNELNWVIGSESSLRETVANIKEIGLVHVLLEHGIDPAILCLTGKWFDLRPTKVTDSLQLWQLPEPEKYSDYRTQKQDYIKRLTGDMSKPTEEQEQSLLWGQPQKNRHTHGIKIRTTAEIELINCCENSKTTILTHNERNAWKIFFDGKRQGSFESRTCHATFSINLRLTESNSMSSYLELKQTLWGIQWTIPHNKQHHPFYNSSLSKLWIPKDVSEFLMQFLGEFDEDWERYCDSIESHLVEHHFAMGSLDSDHINNLGNDLLHLAPLRRTLHLQVKTIEAEIKRYYSTVLEDDREDKNKDLQSRLKFIKQYYTEKLDRFQHTINSISQMEYTRRSIHEATFMRRISVVTFVYLPLMFTASLFGMNVNATEGFPSWQWFLPFAAGFWGLTYLLWKVSGQSATEIKTALESLKRPWGIGNAKNKLGDSV